MGAYILRRLLIAIPSLLGISLILFTVLALAPGDPFGELASNPNVPPEVRAALRYNLCRCGTHVEILRAVLRAAAGAGEAEAQP